MACSGSALCSIAIHYSRGEIAVVEITYICRPSLTNQRRGKCVSSCADRPGNAFSSKKCEIFSQKLGIGREQCCCGGRYSV